MRLLVTTLTAIAALGSVPTALARMQFINPPEFKSSNVVEPSRHSVHVAGAPLEISWTPATKGRKLSVVLYQLNATMAAAFEGEFKASELPFEFITRDQVDVTNFKWLVGTTKDLSVSPMFAIAVWEQGKQVTDSATNLFNITRGAIEPSSSTSSTSSAESSTSTTATTSTATPLTSPTPSENADGVANPTTADPTTPPAAKQSSGGLSTGAAAGLGVGIGLAVLLLAGAGWFWVRQRAGRRQAVTGAVAPGYAQPDKDYYAGPVSELGPSGQVVEAPEGRARYELS